MKYLQEVNDTAKVALATGAPALTLFGYPVETWGYVLSAIVSLMFIIEKIPVFVLRMKQFKRWINGKREE